MDFLGWITYNKDRKRTNICDLPSHPHADHLDLSHLLSRSPDFGTVGASCLYLHASSETLQWAAQTFERDLHGEPFLAGATQEALNVQTHIVRPLQENNDPDSRVAYYVYWNRILTREWVMIDLEPP